MKKTSLIFTCFNKPYDNAENNLKICHNGGDKAIKPLVRLLRHPFNAGISVSSCRRKLSGSCRLSPGSPSPKQEAGNRCPFAQQRAWGPGPGHGRIRALSCVWGDWEGINTQSFLFLRSLFGGTSLSWFCVI